MEQPTVEIRCLNNGQILQIPLGTKIAKVYEATGLQLPHGPMAARVNNKVEGMHYRVYNAKSIEFLDIQSPSGLRAYTRSLFFVLCKAVHDLYERAKVSIDIPVSNGYYVNLDIGHPVTLEDVGLIRSKMQSIIDAALPIHRYETLTEDAIKMFTILHTFSKVKLLKSSGRLYTTYYDIDGYMDYYYGSMLVNTSQLYLFGLEKYFDGLLLRLPSPEHPDELGEMTHQDKMFGIFKEHHQWQDIIGLRTIGDLNEGIEKGYYSQLIQISEALQEKKIAKIAEDIAFRKGIRMILIAGPSSSGKTTTCKRFNFREGRSEMSGRRLRLHDDEILVVEGIHALNPELMSQVPQQQIYRIYASALTTILLDNHNYIPTTDNRLLRRIIRDYKYRGVSAVDTIRRWPSVRAGENKWIFPFQENADAMFNTAMLFELAVIKSQAEPLLDQVPENVPEYSEAYRLKKFLSYIKPIPADQIPPTSLLREFLGGSSFKY